MNHINNLNYCISYLWVTYWCKNSDIPCNKSKDTIFFNKWHFKGDDDDKLNESLFMKNDSIGWNYKSYAWD